MFLFETSDGGMETLHRGGLQPNLPNACVCVWNERGRVNEKRERGQLFSGHAKEEGVALVTWHILMSINVADTPSRSKCQQATDSTKNSISQLWIRMQWQISANNTWDPTHSTFWSRKKNVVEAGSFASNVDSVRNAAGLYWCQFW